MKLDKQEYEIIIRKVYNNIVKNLDSMKNNNYDKLLEEVVSILTENIDKQPEELFQILTEDYYSDVLAISKLSPGLETGLKDIKYGITLNTITGKTSDIPNAPEIDDETVFDCSSITKLFTVILLIKEMEKGNIDLNKTYKDYSSLLEKMNIPIIKALKFGVLVKTDDLVAKPNIDKEERLKILLSAHTIPGRAYDYNDIQYMLVPFLFGDNVEDATDNYLKLFYNLYKNIGLKQTGYSTINMTGGNVHLDKDKTMEYKGLEIFDPKAYYSETEIGLVPAHAGVTTTVKDLEKLFEALSEGLIEEKHIKEMITSAYPEDIYMTDEEGNYILKNKEKIPLKHTMGVYSHIKDIKTSYIADELSKDAFAAIGSTGTYFVFDISNGISYGYLSNIRSGLYARLIDSNYRYGTPGDEIVEGKHTVHLGQSALHKGTMNDGKIERTKENMPHILSTNNFKIKQFETIFKLRVAKLSLLLKAQIENNSSEKYKEEIEIVFNNDTFKKVNENAIKQSKKVVKQKKL